MWQVEKKEKKVEGEQVLCSYPLAPCAIANKRGKQEREAGEGEASRPYPPFGKVKGGKGRAARAGRCREEVKKPIGDGKGKQPHSSPPHSFPPNSAPPHPILSHPIQSHSVLSRPRPPHPIPFRPTTPCLLPFPRCTRGAKGRKAREECQGETALTKKHHHHHPAYHRQTCRRPLHRYG